MYTRCPGQDIQNLRVKLYKCPNCGAEVEIFSDEVSVRCQKCGQKVYSDKMGDKPPSCIEWCASARQCLGEERWRKLKGEDCEFKPEGERVNDNQNDKKNRKNRRGKM